MKRRKALGEAENNIRLRKRYRYDVWCRNFIVPAENPMWSYILIAGGNVLDKLDVSSSQIAPKRFSVIDIDGTPHTVVKIKNGLANSLRCAHDLRAFFHCLSKIVSAEDLKRYHYDLWVAARNLDAAIWHMRELQNPPSVRRDRVGREIDGIFANNTVREAARHYGNL